MSNTNQAASATSAAAGAVSSRKRPRHFHQGPHEAEQQQQQQQRQEEPAAAAAAQPPAARLYTHALESIFGFLSLADLNQVLAVSRSWSGAVDSMHSIEATVASLPADRPLFELCASRLAHHIGVLGSEDKPVELSPGKLFLVGLRMTGLHTLHHNLPSPLLGPLLFPPSLTELTVHPHTASAQEINSMILGASCLPELRHLVVFESQFHPLLDLAPLHRSTLPLVTLGISFLDGQMSLQHADDMRAIPNLTYLDTPFYEAEVRQLLRAPHQLKLQTLDIEGDLDAESTALVASLASLSRLNFTHATRIPLLDALPNLNTLQLADFPLRRHSESVPLEQMIQGLGLCSISTLILWHYPLTSAHMSALLSRMPALSALCLGEMRQLESLSFLSSLADRLADLELKNCRHSQMKADQLQHLECLKRLTSLEIRDCFSERLDSLTLKELKLPSKRLPKLIKSVIECADP